MPNPQRYTPSEPDPDYDAMNIRSLGAVAGSNADISGALQYAQTRIDRSSAGKGVTYVPPGIWYLLSSATLSENHKLYLEYGAQINVASGKTLTLNGGCAGLGGFAGAGTITINGAIDNSLNQKFDSAVTVVFGGAVTELFPQWWGAKSDGTNATTTTAAINAMITAANRIGATKGMFCTFPPGVYATNAQLTNPAIYVTLRGGATWARAGVGFNTSTITTTLTDRAMWDLGNGTTGVVTFEDLCLRGQASGDKNAHGIYATSAAQMKFYRMRFDTFGGSAISIQGGTGLSIRDIIMDGCLKAYATLATYQGTLDIGCLESYVENAEISGGLLSSTFDTPGSGYACAVHVHSAPHSFTNVTAQFGQTGWYFSSSGTGGDFIKLTKCRGEFNQCEGYLAAGSKIIFTDCTAINNSRGIDDHLTSPVPFVNAYDGWRFTSTGFQNHLVDCTAYGNNANYKQRYGFNDGASGASDNLSNANHYTDCNGTLGIGIRALFVATNAIHPMIAPIAKGQSLSGTTTLTFDGQAGDYWDATISGNTSTQITATQASLLPDHLYYLRIAQHSGAPTLTLDGTIFAKTATFTSPAASKVLSGVFKAVGTPGSLVLHQSGAWSGDM